MPFFARSRDSPTPDVPSALWLCARSRDTSSKSQCFRTPLSRVRPDRHTYNATSPYHRTVEPVIYQRSPSQPVPTATRRSYLRTCTQFTRGTSGVTTPRVRRDTTGGLRPTERALLLGELGVELGARLEEVGHQPVVRDLRAQDSVEIRARSAVRAGRGGAMAVRASTRLLQAD